MKIERGLTEKNVNRNLLNIQYAVRGAILDRALQIEKELGKGVQKPFKRVVRANIGDCHALGQRPLTFIRQVLALAACPDLMSSPSVPDDVKRRVKKLLGDCTNGSVGAYSPASGLSAVKQSAVRYLQKRDGIPAAPDQLFLGSGASDLVRAVLSLFTERIDGKPSAVMIPIPQYPLFSGTLSELGLEQAPYFLDEDNGWSISVSELQRSWKEASTKCQVRALVVINPGNPTGQVLSRENIEEIVKFAYDHNLFILADEVYQENIISKPFHSFKKVIHDLGAPYSSLDLASFLTLSKGWAAECGLRAALCELCVKPAVARAFSAARALPQCPSVLGQCALDCVLQPPSPGEESHAQWENETRYLHRVLSERASTAHRTFNSIPGYSCNVIDGSMFAFPRVEIPLKAQEAAQKLGMKADEFYCLRLLEATGICVVPGSGFGQLPGSHHFRTTILHQSDELQHMLHSIRRFHHHFLEEHA